MSDSIESMQRPPLEDVLLPTADLHPDPMNPNYLGERRRAALKRDMITRGFFRPVVVRPRAEGGWTIIDGEHRWRILREIGEEKTPCIIDDADPEEGRMRLMTLAKLHGTFDPVREANLLVKVAAHLGEEELREQLGMGPEEYAEITRMKDAGADLDAKMAKELEREEADAPEVLRWKLGPRQAQQVERALDGLAADGRSRADALIEILKGRS